MYRLVFKRTIDLIFGIVLIVLFLPFLLIFSLLIRLESKGPVFYIQPRLGKDGNIFQLFKLRSMTHKPRTAHAQVIPGDPEVTNIGSFIRRFKVDELPQLLNIIKGDMSFVGPRPCLPELAKVFDENGRWRIKVRPGLTGLAQINGNVYLSWPERWVFDRKYVETITFWLDVCIIMKTLAIVILGEKDFLKK